MTQIKRILVTLDPHIPATSESQPAITTGITLARQLQAELHLGLVQYNDQLPKIDGDANVAREKFLATWQRWLDGLIAKLDTSGIPAVHGLLAWDHPWHDGILRQAIDLKADLVIKDIHHHPRWGKRLFTNTDWHLVRECPMALLMQKDGRWHQTPRFLAAVDPLHERDKPADLDRRILEQTESLRAAVDGTLEVFHSYLPSLNLPVEAGGVPMELHVEQHSEAVEHTHLEALDALVASQPRAPESVVLRQGAPAETLLTRIDEQQVDVVVMGAVARGALKRLFLGSTAERVFAELSTDLLVVKPDDFVCPVELH